MAINFPDSPTLNQVFSAGGRTWKWDGTTWVSVGAELVVADITDITASATEINYTDGVTSAIQTQLNARALLTQVIEAKTGAYTLTAAEKGELVTCSGTFTLTVPGNVFVAGDRVDVINIGTGTITFAGSSLTLTSADAKVTIAKQWAGATIFFTSATTAVLIGNLA
jgi:TolB-like protein